MKPNWTICVVSALIDVLQNTIYSLNLHEIWLKIHFSFIIVWKWWVIGLWNTRSSERFPSSRRKKNEEKEFWTRHDWHFIHHRAAKLNIAESNLIWVAKNSSIRLLLQLLMLNLEGIVSLQGKRCTTATSDCRVSQTRQKKSVADYLTTNFTFIRFIDNFLLRKLTAIAPRKKDNEASWVNKKIMIKNTLE